MASGSANQRFKRVAPFSSCLWISREEFGSRLCVFFWRTASMSQCLVAISMQRCFYTVPTLLFLRNALENIIHSHDLMFAVQSNSVLPYAPCCLQMRIIAQIYSKNIRESLSLYHFQHYFAYYNKLAETWMALLRILFIFSSS